MSATRGRRPNILVIFPDQWRGDALSTLGHPAVETPFLDALAAEGTLFTHAYTNSPVCIPARACLITGRTPNGTGRLGYRDRVNWRYDQTMMTVLRDGGYQTMGVGKTHFYPPRAHLGFEQLALYDSQYWPGARSDYEIWLDRESGGQIRDTATELDTNSQLVQPWTHDEALHPSTWTVTAAIDMLERRDPTRPFFMYLGFHRPHPPLDPPVEYLRRYSDVELPEIPVGDWVGWDEPERRIDQAKGTMTARASDRARRAYFAQMTHIDYQIGRTMRWLRTRGLLDDTIVVFSSDHGEMLGDHHLYRKSAPFEGSLHVPMIIRTAKSRRAPGDERRDEPVALHDVMPTVLELAELPVPDSVEGSSMVPLIGADAGVGWRTHVHAEQSQGPIGPWQCVTDGHHKYAWCTLSGDEYFFDLDADPQERHNLVGSPESVAELARWRARLVAELRDRDGFVVDGQLVPGHAVPAIRPELLDGAD